MTALPGFEQVAKTARLSACGRYRYRLTRRWDPAPALGWVMLNPSTADADQDDPTIRRCMAFARREGCGGIDVANLFAWRATDPRELIDPADITGPGNRWNLDLLFSRCSAVVAAWGPKYRETVRRRRNVHGVLDEPITEAEVVASAELHDVDLVCLGTTKDGSPRHPLYVPGDQPLVGWEP